MNSFLLLLYLTGKPFSAVIKNIFSCLHILTPSPSSGDGLRLAYTGQNINTRILCQILTAPVGRVWRLTHFYSVALLLEKRFACHHSTPYFFITLFPTAFYNRSRMTGKQLILFRMKSFYVFAHTCPFRRLRRHLSQGKACVLYFSFSRVNIFYFTQQKRPLARSFCY